MEGRYEMVRIFRILRHSTVLTGYSAFQTAVALAEHRAEKGEGGKTLVTEEHLQEVIELARSFKMYFDTLHGSEGRRALDRGERLEKFIKAIEEHF